MTHSRRFLDETSKIATLLDSDKIEAMAGELVSLRKRGGRLFVVGLGGSAANASHLVADIRKLCGIEAYAPTDNIAELTARANDEGWPIIFNGFFWKFNDALLVLSVGGGTEKVSLPLVGAVTIAKVMGMKVFGIVGRNGGYTATHADCCVIVPTVSPERVTPHTEAFQAVVWHCLVSHPDLQINKTKW